jgi:hypothetical protein
MNAHSVYHLVDYVRHHGPLWTFWAFPFESALGSLSIHCHGKRLVENQLALAANFIQSLPAMAYQASCLPNLSEMDQSVCYVKPLVICGLPAFNRYCMFSRERPGKNKKAHYGQPSQIEWL